MMDIPASVEYIITVRVVPGRGRNNRSLLKRINRLKLKHDNYDAAANAAQRIAELDDVISAVVDIVMTGRLAAFGHGMPA